MKTTRNSTRWLGLVLACGTLTFALTTQAAKPVKPPSSGAEYVPVLLGGLRSSDGVIRAEAFDINNAGQVVGDTCLPGYPSSSSSYNCQAFLLNPRDVNGDGKLEWFVDQDADGQNDLICGLGTLPTPSPTSWRQSHAYAVNDLGMVVGTSSCSGVSEAFIVVPKDINNDGQPDCWFEDLNGDGFNDLMLPLGRPPGIPSFLKPYRVDINNLGQVVGYFDDPNSSVNPSVGFLLTPILDGQGAWQWFQDDGTGANALMENLGTFDPQAINDNGQTIGYHATLLNPDGSSIDLTAGDNRYRATCLNNCGQIGLNFSSDHWDALLLTPVDANNDGTPDTWFRDANSDAVNDLMVDLGVVSGLENSVIYGLNDAGAVVGVSARYSAAYTPNKHVPFLWRNGGLKTLKDLTGGTMDFWSVSAINNAGQIVCQAWSRDAYILVPAH